MVVLAELEIRHSRPFAPTRRIALASSRLPVDPAPGPGGVLLGAVAAHHRDALDDELHASMMALTLQVQEGQRIVQPRLRHRFQEDHHGLTKSRMTLVKTSDGLRVVFDTKGTSLQLLLGAVYTAGTLSRTSRPAVMDAFRKGLNWTGPLDGSLFSHLSGLGRGRSFSADAAADPVAWALAILGIEERDGDGGSDAGVGPDRRLVQRRFRDALRDAHPDHGGDGDDAARRINDLTEARRILLS